MIRGSRPREIFCSTAAATSSATFVKQPSWEITKYSKLQREKRGKKKVNNKPKYIKKNVQYSSFPSGKTPS